MDNGKPRKHGVSSGHVEPIPAFDPPAKPKRNKYALACSFLASMTSILLGYDIGVMTGAIIYIRKNIRMTEVQEEVIMGILNLYSLLGAAAAGRTSDWIGRRYTIVLAGVIFFAGALLMGLATDYAFLMTGRFVAGIGVGYALMIAPVYTAEVAPASSRGFLTSFPEVFINFGCYYLCDNGYANVEGCLTPYRRVRYHRDAWGNRANGPQNNKALFNWRHAQARNRKILRFVEKKMGHTSKSVVLSIEDTKQNNNGMYVVA